MSIATTTTTTTTTTNIAVDDATVVRCYYLKLVLMPSLVFLFILF